MNSGDAVLPDKAVDVSADTRTPMVRGAQAAGYFLSALAADPLVGGMVRRPGERGISLAARMVKPYLSAPWCVMKEVFHVVR